MHLLKIKDLRKEEILEILNLSQSIETNTMKYADELKQKTLGVLFFQPSTRTRLGFSVAMQKLGGNVAHLSETKFTECMSEEESLEDTIRVMGDYCDILCIRDKSENSAKSEIKPMITPVINCGNGSDEHPTQTLIDLYTILKELGRLNNLRVTVVGDLKNMRAAHSLIQGLSLFENNSAKLISPPSLRMPQKYLDEVRSTLDLTEANTLNVLNEDIIYMAGLPPFKEEGYTREDYQLNLLKMKNARKSSIVMDPLPRIDEISREVDGCSNSKYFEQSRNGLFVRMAILLWLLKFPHKDQSS